jgi:uncharacterized protein involved in outer membrane biogenesis
MRRFLIISLLVLAVVFIVLLVVALWLVNDEEFLKAQASKYTERFTGRELVIAGPLDIDLGFETSVIVEGVSLSNPPWADQPDMVRVSRAEVTLKTFSLLSDLPLIPYIMVDDCAVEVLGNENGDSNWDFPAGDEEPEEEEPEDDKGGPLPVGLTFVSIQNCSLFYDTPDRDRPLDLQLASVLLEHGGDDRVVTEISGNINGEALDGHGWVEPAAAFVHGGGLDLELSLQVGDVTLEGSGSVDEINTLAGPDIQARFSGPDIGKLLADYALPPLSSGVFDFRAAVNVRDGMVNIDVDGDLGELSILADGKLDKLAHPGQGNLNFSSSGPDLRALGEAVGVENLVADPFTIDTAFHFEDGFIRVEHARVGTEGDSLEFTGTVATGENMAGTNVHITLGSTEIGRWLPLAGRPEQALGAASLESDAVIDNSGILSIDGQTTIGSSHLQASGTIGPLAGPVAPDLDLSFRSEDMPVLAALADLENFPDKPFKLSGHVKLQGQELQLSGMELALDRTTAKINGAIQLENSYSGSQVEAEVNIPDAAEFGLLFGFENLRHVHAHATGTAKLEDGGLVFRVDDGSAGDVRVKLDGRIPDLEQPDGVEADFDLALPSLRFLEAALPDIPLPEGEFAASGRIVNSAEHIELDEVSLQLGEIKAQVDGHLVPDGELDFSLQAGGPDASVLNELTGIDLPALPFSADVRLAGTPQAFNVEALDLKVGKSEVRGDLQIELGEPRRVSGSLTSPYLNLNHFTETEEEPEETAPPAEPARYVFGDIPIASSTDIGVELDLQLTIDALEVLNARYDKLEVGLLLRSDRLEVRPFRVFGKWGGIFSGDLVLDNSGTLPELELRLDAENMKVELGAKQGQDVATLPTGSLDVELHGNGRTRRDMASGLNGSIRVHMGPGQLAPMGGTLFTSDFLTELLRTLNPFSETQEYTELDCVVAAADIVSGQAALKPLLVVTHQITIVSDGKVDLDTERLDISFNTKQRKGLGISATDLVNPFVKVGGTLASPSLELDPAGTVIKGGIAVATAGLSILAGSLAERYLSSKDPCGKALKEIRERDGEG